MGKDFDGRTVAAFRRALRVATQPVVEGKKARGRKFTADEVRRMRALGLLVDSAEALRASNISSDSVEDDVISEHISRMTIEKIVWPSDVQEALVTRTSKGHSNTNDFIRLITVLYPFSAAKPFNPKKPRSCDCGNSMLEKSQLFGSKVFNDVLLTLIATGQSGVVKVKMLVAEVLKLVDDLDTLLMDTAIAKKIFDWQAAVKAIIFMTDSDAPYAYLEKLTTDIDQ